MTDPQDACFSCGHARHLHHPDHCVFARDVPGDFCRCESFADEPSFTAARLHELGELTPEEGETYTRSTRDPQFHERTRHRPMRAPPREPPLPAQRVAEMLSEIAEMRAVQTRIYHVGLKMPHGEWQAFAALVSVFASMCEIVIEQGYDYAFEAECAVVPEFKAKYLGEKFRRVFGPFLSTPECAAAFLEHAGFRKGDTRHGRDPV